MRGFEFSLAGVELVARGSGALWWPGLRILVVSDLHLGKSERVLRLGGAPLPPYEAQDTLARLEQDIEACDPALVICLGDSFDDDLAAQGLPEPIETWLTRLQAGRRWTWIEGNHDPGPVGLGGAHLFELPQPPLTFRHIAQPGAAGEVSGHYHPKARLSARGRSVSRRCFLLDCDRLILPAYGTYTGGLRSEDAALTGLMRPEALAILTGPVPRPIAMPR